MVRRSALAVASVALVLALGCAPSAPSAPPTPTTAPTSTPVPTPTPLPPTPTPAPAVSPGGPLAGMAQAMSKVRSYRMSMDVAGQFPVPQGPGAPSGLAMKGEGEVVGTDVHMVMSSTALLPMELEMMKVGKTTYMKMGGGQWMAFAEGQGPGGAAPSAEAKTLADFARLLSDVSVTPKGAIVVHGVPCDNYGFVIPKDRWQQAVAELAPSGGAASGVAVADVNGEVALAKSDKLPRRFVMNLQVESKTEPGKQFTMTTTMEMWDLNDRSIVIQPPPGVTPGALPFMPPGMGTPGALPPGMPTMGALPPFAVPTPPGG